MKHTYAAIDSIENAVRDFHNSSSPRLYNAIADYLGQSTGSEWKLESTFNTQFINPNTTPMGSIGFDGSAVVTGKVDNLILNFFTKYHPLTTVKTEWKTGVTNNRRGALFTLLLKDAQGNLVLHETAAIRGPHDQIEKPSVDVFKALRDASEKALSDLASPSRTKEALVAAINQQTGMNWRLAEAPLAAGSVRKGTFAATFPSFTLAEQLSAAVYDGLKGYYDDRLVVRSDMFVGYIGNARCMQFTIAARVSEENVFVIKAIMTLDDTSMFDEIPDDAMPSIVHIMESIPDAGDRSRNEPVYLMSAKATRSLLDGHAMDRSLDEIRRVSKQSGWSDVQAFGQQLLFIS